MLGFAHAWVLKGGLNFVNDINMEQSRTKFASSRNKYPIDCHSNAVGERNLLWYLRRPGLVIHYVC